VKYVITLLSTVLIAYSFSTGRESTISSKHNLNYKDDSLWQERNNFLSHPVFQNQSYQDSILDIYQGLWRCVKTVRNRDGKVEYPNFMDRFITDSKFHWIDYPCSSNGYYTDIHFRNDSIFFSRENRVYIEKKKIEFKEDTLVIFGTKKSDEYEYFIRVEYDTTIISKLNKYSYNHQCIEGTWELDMIGDGGSDSWVIQDGYLEHVPRKIDFSDKKFRFDGEYLVNTSNPEIKFQVLQFDRGMYYPEKNPGDFFAVRELKKIKGIVYYYHFIKTGN